MSSTPLKRRRATIFVTGPHSKKTIYSDEDGINEEMVDKKNPTLQDVALARQWNHNNQIAVNTANSIEILVQIFMDEFEMIRHHIRENGQRMRNFFSKHFSPNRIRQLLRIFAKSKNKMLDYKKDVEVVFNQMQAEEAWKPPRYTLNDMEEVMTTDDLENGVVQRRSEKWECLPIRMKPEPADDSICEFQKMNMPMAMTFEDDDDDRLSMPSTRTVLTTEDQMQAIQAQLAMLSKQLVTLQKTTTANMVKEERVSSRASSRKGGRKMEKKASVEVTSTSSSSDISEDEGKGASVCSPAHSLQKKVAPTKVDQPTPVPTSRSSPVSLPPVVVPTSIPPPPPPPPPMGLISMSLQKTPKKIPMEKPNSKSNSLPPVENNGSSRPYLTDIANGRSLLKKTIRSPGGSPMSLLANNRKPLSSFEAALRDRFKGFHGDASFSEQEENEEEEDFNATWDE